MQLLPSNFLILPVEYVQLVNYARKAFDVNKAFNPAGVQGHAPPVARIAWLSSPELEVKKEEDFLVEDQNRLLPPSIC
jgi:hypothetical protein